MADVLHSLGRIITTYYYCAAYSLVLFNRATRARGPWTAKSPPLLDAVLSARMHSICGRLVHTATAPDTQQGGLDTFCWHF